MPINLYGFNGFALSSKDRGSKEQMAISITANMDKIPCRIFHNTKDIPDNWIPCGSVEWCESYIGKRFKPDYYPDFLQDYLHRKVWETNEWILGKKVFIKPSDRYKRFTGFVTSGGHKGKRKGPYWCSEVVRFINEWRYYIANGRVLSGEWYSGDEINAPDAPDLKIDFPSEYCGAVDFGMTDNDQLVLVEANHPFACGWYGKKHEIYTEWIVEGWRYIVSGKNIS